MRALPSFGMMVISTEWALGIVVVEVGPPVVNEAGQLDQKLVQTRRELSGYAILEESLLLVTASHKFAWGKLIVNNSGGAFHYIFLIKYL